MRNHWTRETVIRHLVERQAQGLPLTVGANGVGLSMYGSARRIFGSWRNAIQAAGIAPQHVMTWERWSPARILVMIRHLARRKRPLSARQVDRQYHRLVTAARRHFGTWTKAMLAAGVDPTKLQKVINWNPERVVETILMRALRNESLVARLVEPHSLVEAGNRFFGGWQAAITAAGLDPALTVMPPRLNTRSGVAKSRPPRTKSTRTPARRWTKELVVTAILDRVRDQKRVNAAALKREDYCMYQAMRRLMGNWHEAMREAGLDPKAYRCGSAGIPPSTEAGQRDSVARQSQADGALRPDRPAQEQ